MASEIAETAATALVIAMNQCGGREDAEYIVSHLLYMHPTLNQAFTSRIVLRFVQEMAKMFSAGRYDARNEAACKLCREMWDKVKEVYDLPTDDDPLECAMI